MNINVNFIDSQIETTESNVFSTLSNINGGNILKENIEMIIDADFNGRSSSEEIQNENFIDFSSRSGKKRL